MMANRRSLNRHPARRDGAYRASSARSMRSSRSRRDDFDGNVPFDGRDDFDSSYNSAYCGEASDEDGQDFGDVSARRYARGYSGGVYASRLNRRQRKRRIITRVLVALLVLIGLGAGGAFAYVNMINGNFSSGLDKNLDDALVKTNLTKEPFYMVLLGTDASLERQNDAEYAELFRTDTIILARIDPVNGKVTLVSLPRDTKIEMAQYGTQKLNAAYALGGASSAVEEVSELSGVGISHFCLVDMDGLKQVVDGLGGIEVDVPVTIDDEDAGGHVDSGLHTLSGDEALILCRARHSFDLVGAGDAFRAANQRLVLQAIANKALSSDVATIAKTATTLSEYVSTDLTVKEIVSLAQAFQGMDVGANMYTGSMPTTSEYVDDLWYEVVVQDEWRAMMKRVGSGLPPTESTEIDSVTGTVIANAGDQSTGEGNVDITKDGWINVRNGTSHEGLGGEIAKTLEAAGYYVVDVANADADNYKTSMVIYDEHTQEAEARQIAEAMGGAEVVHNDGSYTTHEEFLVVVGADKAK